MAKGGWESAFTYPIDAPAGAILSKKKVEKICRETVTTKKLTYRKVDDLSSYSTHRMQGRVCCKEASSLYE